MGVSGIRLCNNECLHRIPLYGSYEYLTSCHYTKVFAGKLIHSHRIVVPFGYIFAQ